MARISKIFASGSIAKVIFYELNGTPCARSKPAHVRQTAATKMAGQQFGSAKTLSRLLRQAFSDLLLHHSSKPVMYHVDNCVRPWIQTMQASQQGITPLPGFSCTTAAELSSLFRKEINTQLNGNTLLLTIPATAQDAIHPAGASKAILSFAVAIIHLQQSQLLHYDQQGMEIGLPLTLQPSKVFSFEAASAPGNIIAVAANIKYMHEQNGKSVVVDKPGWQAMSVLQGWYCG